MNSITPIIKNLLIINVLIFVSVAMTPLGQYIPDLKVYFPGSEHFRPYQLVTHMFMHGSISHLAFNMLALFFLGPYVERYTGERNFFIFYFLCGFGAILAHIGIQYYQHFTMGIDVFPPALGASGAVMGVLIAFAVLYPNVKLMLLFPPIPIKAKYFALGYVLFDLFSGIGGFQPGVANFAHLGGAATGFILTFFWLKKAGWS
jgi:membrane associated rhomboid family serine protease